MEGPLMRAPRTHFTVTYWWMGSWRWHASLRVGAQVVVAFVSLLTLGIPLQAWADLLVASFDTKEVLRYDDTSGTFLGAFAVGLPDDHPIAMTVGADGNLYVGV